MFIEQANIQAFELNFYVNRQRVSHNKNQHQGQLIKMSFVIR